MSVAGRRKNSYVAYVFLAPALILLGVFVLYPFLDNFKLALYQSSPSPLIPSTYVGPPQFWQTITSSTFLQGLQATLIYTAIVVPFGLLFGLLLAVLANQKLRGMVIYRTIFSTTVISGVAVSAVIFDTLLNPVVGILPWLGININPLTSPTWALPVNALIGVWSYMGLAFIFCLAGLQSVDTSVLEAAECDGAGWWSTLFRVTIPMLSPTLFAALTLGTISALFSFGTINLLIGANAPSVNANVLGLQIYNNILVNQNFGIAACLCIALFIVTLIITGVMFRFLERRVSYAR